MRRFVLCLATALAMLALPAAAEARTFFFDTHEKSRGPNSGPIKTERLTRGKPYLIEVRGTFSLFGAADYRQRLCGAPEAQPQYRSRGVRNGPVGADAVFLFADLAGNCERNRNRLHYTTFETSIDGRRYRDLTPAGGAPQGPRPDHTYTFAAVGLGKIVRFRVFDRFPNDNYGRLRIRIRPARAADCASEKFRDFGYADEASCVRGTKRKAQPRPRSRRP